MLKTRIIPCLDVKDGRTVKGVNFVDLRDAGDPVELARAYSEAGADELCFLDITASHEGRGTMLDVVTRTAEQCFMPLTVGGGVRTPQDMVQLLRAGADKVAINSAAVADPQVIADCAARVGRQCVVVAIDARLEGDRYTVYTHGGRTSSGVDAVEHAIRAEELGAGEILLTSMDKDGTKSGFDIAMLKAVTAAVNVPVIASGGAGSAADFGPAVIDGGASAVLAASIFHFGDVSLAEARAALAEAGAPVRPVQGDAS
ncbi:MAG: imidazole glycerol phosphate synthase subunit HisF [Hyphomonadaceae bacterium]|nr:imidazole glycerol phosphate synthase subunit HisF [Hyphomonadaceae bacterium]